MVSINPTPPQTSSDPSFSPFAHSFGARGP